MTDFQGNILPYNGKWPKIADDVFIAPGASVIGDVEIGAGSSVWFNCVLRGDDNPIRIGKRVNVQDGTVIHVHIQTQGTYIGDDVTIGHMALLHACNIADKAFVGMGSIVLDEGTIETQRHARRRGHADAQEGDQIGGTVERPARQAHARVVDGRDRGLRLVGGELFRARPGISQGLHRPEDRGGVGA